MLLLLNGNPLCKCPRVIVALMWSDIIVAQQCVTMTSVPIVAQHRVLTVGPRFPLLRNNDPGHADCVLPRKKTRSTDRHMDKPICSSLTLEEQQQKKGKDILRVTALPPFY
jgi:hypothetical protein